MQWFYSFYVQHPYPTEDEKRTIAAQTNLTILQVNNWWAEDYIPLLLKNIEIPLLLLSSWPYYLVGLLRPDIEISKIMINIFSHTKLMPLPVYILKTQEQFNKHWHNKFDHYILKPQRVSQEFLLFSLLILNSSIHLHFCFIWFKWKLHLGQLAT